MISKSEIRFAARLVHLGLVSKADMETVLKDLDRQRKRRRDSSIDDILVERGHVTQTEIPLIREEKDGSRAVRVKGFKIHELMGEGGMSRVYRASPVVRPRPMALKILHPHIARKRIQVIRFYQEANHLIQFDHSNLVHGYKVWESEGLHCFAMEYVDGVSVLDEIESGRKFEETEALSIILQAARALVYLSGEGITHRDVKPGNLLLDSQGEVKLIDLGLAQDARTGPQQRPGTTVGTVQYVSPEQARGAEDLDVRADIYSLGVSLYHIVVGEVPFSGETDRDILRQQIFTSLKSPRARDRRITPHLHYFIEKMMAKDRELRYQSPEELISDIEEKIQGREDVLLKQEEPRKKKTTPVQNRPRRHRRKGRFGGRY